MIKRRTNTFSMTVQRKLLKTAEIFVTTAKGGRKETRKDCIQQATSWIWQPPGIEPLTEAHYRELQKLGEFDTKSQSWLKTPAAIADLGGAVFAHRRFNTVFVCPNTAPCFYGGRGFRGSLRV